MPITEQKLVQNWTKCNGKILISQYIQNIRHVGSGDHRLLLIQYRDNYAGDNSTSLGKIGSLDIYSRRRLRAPYHVTLRAFQELHPQPNVWRDTWTWAPTPEDLASAIEFACTTGFIVTLSTIKSGASRPLLVHFQGLPRTINRYGNQYRPFETLFRAPHERIILQKPDLQVSTVRYPAFVARIAGTSMAVCQKTLHLALGYDHLCAFNLIITVNDTSSPEKCQVEAYFFPRRFDGQVRPTDRLPSWAFGSWEMGGVFLTKDAEIYNTATYPLMVDALTQTSIQPQSPEQRTIDNLLLYP